MNAMKCTKANPFDECPVYETESFLYTRVSEEDAEDLFVCYSDPVTLQHMNNDNCGGAWRPASPDELRYAWQKDYERRTFLRWSIKDKTTHRAVGTIEIAPLPWGRWFFGDVPPIGILRIDLLSSFEKQAYFSEIIRLLATEVAGNFEVTTVILKAPPDEPERIAALVQNHFRPDVDRTIDFDHYYIRKNPIASET